MAESASGASGGARVLRTGHGPRCDVEGASLHGGRLTLRGAAVGDAAKVGGGAVRRTFLLRDRDRTEERRFPVTDADPSDPAAFAVDLDLASAGTLPAREAVWDAYVAFESGGFESGGGRYERRVAASFAALPKAVPWRVGRRAFDVTPYTTMYGNVSFRVVARPRPPVLQRPRRWVVSRIVKPPVRSAGQAAVQVLRALDGRRSRRTVAGRSTADVHILLMHAYGMGGTIRTVHNLAGYLARDHRVTLYSVVRKAEQPFFPFPDGVRVVPLDDRTDAGRPRGARGLLCAALSRLPSVIVHADDGAYQTSSLWTDVMLLRTIRGLRAGVLVTTRPSLNLLGALFARPEVITVGQEHMNLATHRRGLRGAIRRHYGKLDALAVLTETDRDSYRQVLSTARTRLVRIPNAVPELDGGPADLSSKTVVAAGRLGNQKGYDMLVRAFAGVKARHPDWTLRIYGSGQWRDRLQRMIAEYGLSRHVFLMGRAAHMGEEFAKGSIFALSSRFEGFPMVLIEAMSKGLPVVAFDCPTGPAEVVVTGRNGVLVDLGDVDGFADGLSRLIENDDERRRCGEGARDTARDYALDVVGARWDRLLAELAT